MVYGAILTGMAEAASRRAADATGGYDESMDGNEGGARPSDGDGDSEVASVGSTGADAPPQ
jgi:hypothetical protein